MIDEQNELNYVEAFHRREDMKEKTALTRYLLWLEDRGAASIDWVARKDKDGETKAFPVLGRVHTERFPIFQQIHNRYIAELARRDTAKKVKI